jgi:hypothetical protein
MVFEHLKEIGTMKVALFTICCAVLITFASCSKCVECTLTQYCFSATQGASTDTYCSYTFDEAEALRDSMQANGYTTENIYQRATDSNELCARSSSERATYQDAQEAMSYECTEK